LDKDHDGKVHSPIYNRPSYLLPTQNGGLSVTRQNATGDGNRVLERATTTFFQEQIQAKNMQKQLQEIMKGLGGMF
jgi:hypothetical protein